MFRLRYVVELNIPKDPGAPINVAWLSAATAQWRPNVVWHRALSDRARCVSPIGPILHYRVYEMQIEHTKIVLSSGPHKFRVGVFEGVSRVDEQN